MKKDVLKNIDINHDAIRSNIIFGVGDIDQDKIIENAITKKESNYGKTRVHPVIMDGLDLSLSTNEYLLAYLELIKKEKIKLNVNMSDLAIRALRLKISESTDKEEIKKLYSEIYKTMSDSVAFKSDAVGTILHDCYAREYYLYLKSLGIVIPGINYETLELALKEFKDNAEIPFDVDRENYINIFNIEREFQNIYGRYLGDYTNMIANFYKNAQDIYEPTLQMTINTLISHRSHLVTHYLISKEGILTRNTVSGNYIEETHDYRGCYVKRR